MCSKLWCCFRWIYSNAPYRQWSLGLCKFHRMFAWEGRALWQSVSWCHKSRDRGADEWLATIPDKTTWEFLSLHAHYPTQQHYFNNIPLRPGQCCFLQMSKDQGCFRTHNNIASKGRGEGRTRYSENIRKNGLRMWHFLNSFVQDCVYGVLRFPARKLWMTKRNGINKKHFTEAVLDTKFYTTWSSHRKVRALFRFFRVPSENRKILQ